jgi:hypothetical protein
MLSWFRALMPREERPMEYSAGIALDQSTLMPAALMIGHHLSMSARVDNDFQDHRLRRSSYPDFSLRTLNLLSATNADQ